MNKVLLFVFGTRPEAIKMAPVIIEAKRSGVFLVKVAVTAQHRGLLDDVLQIFEIVPDYDLDLMLPQQSLQQLTSKILFGLEQVFDEVSPDMVLVHGDTVSTSAAAFASYLKGIEVGHVEAGLRTFNLWKPWPEEGNRKLVGALASLHFAPTEEGVVNLKSEGVSDDRVFLTGNSVIDALFFVSKKFDNDKNLLASVDAQFPFLSYSDRIVLVTCHRRESFGAGVRNVCLALKKLSAQHPDVKFIFPVHPNPNIKVPVSEILSEIKNIHLIEPQGYIEFVYLMKRAYLILTDSGGIQEEAPSLGKPVLVLRDVTERPEAVAHGTVQLVGTSISRIVDASNQLFEDSTQYKKMTRRTNPYGDGNASKYIVEALSEYWQRS